MTGLLVFIDNVTGRGMDFILYNSTLIKYPVTQWMVLYLQQDSELLKQVWSHSGQ